MKLNNTCILSESDAGKILSLLGNTAEETIFLCTPPCSLIGITVTSYSDLDSFRMDPLFESYDSEQHSLLVYESNVPCILRFFEPEDPVFDGWKNIHSYCDQSAAAKRCLEEELSHLLKKKGPNTDSFTSSLNQFLHHFSFEASVYLHQRTQNFIEDLFEQGTAHPGRTAVVDRNGTRSVSYEQFISLIKKAATKIKRLQLTPHSYIIINMDRCMEYHAAMYAVVLSGHAFVPLVPDTPQAREAYIREESESEFTIRNEFFDDLDQYEEYKGTMPAESDPAMMLYTSGSTGRPKGVYYSFGVLSRCYQYAEFILEDIDPIIYASSIALSFAAIAVDTFHIYCLGGTMHILSDDVRKDINLMNAYYKEHGITCGNVHPRLHRYLDGGDQLKRIFTSGHRITDFYSDRFETILGYGLAETFAVPTYFRLDHAYTTTPVGHAHGGYTVIVCDSNGNEVPDGIQGEVRIKGDIACGYFKMPELTAETFEKQPDGTVLLHTHDIGYKDENGDLVLLNRDDWLVKINGMSVNPAEIDYAMSHIPNIRESAAKGFTDKNGNSYICDYYVTDDDTLTPETLKNYLGNTLMPYMIPAVFVRMDHLPQTISSKVDYTALKAPERFSENTVYEAPADETETRICKAFEKVLGRSRIGRNDDFFESGGDSLSLIELLSVLDDARLSLADIAVLKTPKALAALLASAEKEPELSETTNEYLLTPYQSHYLSACSHDKFITIGNSPYCIRLSKGNITAHALQKALMEVFHAHPSFATKLIQKEDGSTVQTFSNDPFPQPEIRSVAEESVQTILDEYLKPINLSGFPLFHTIILETETNLYLFLDVHHIIFDHDSFQIVLRDLAERIHGNRLKQDYYRNYLFRMNQRAAQMRLLQKELSEKFPESEYIRHPAFDQSDFSYHTETICLNTVIRPEMIRRLNSGKRASVQNALIACALYALHKDTGSNHVLAGWIYKGRDSSRKLNMTGLLISSLLSSADFSKIQTPEALLELIQAETRDSLPLAELSPGSLAGGISEKDIMTVNYHGSTDDSAFSGAETISLVNQNRANTCIFYIILRETERNLGELLFKYNDTVYSREHIEQFAAYFLEAVRYVSDKDPWLQPK